MSGTPFGDIASTAGKAGSTALRGVGTMAGAASDPSSVLQSILQKMSGPHPGPLADAAAGVGGPLNTYVPSSMSDSATGGVAVASRQPTQLKPYTRPPDMSDRIAALTKPGQSAAPQPAGPSLASQGANGANAAMMAAIQGQPYAPEALKMGVSNVDPQKLAQLAKILFA